MALNGDALSADAWKRAMKASNALFKNFMKYVASCKAVFASSMSELAKKRQEAKLMEQYGVTKEFRQYLAKGGELMSVDVADSDYLDFSRFMKQQGVPFIASDVLKDNAKCIRYRASDKERVQTAIEEFIKRRELVTEYSPEKFIEEFKTADCLMVKGLSMIELELVRHYAKDEQLKFTALAVGDSKCDIKFLEEDKEKMDAVMQNIGWQMTGERAALIKTQIDNRIQGRQDLHLEPDAAVKEYCIVSKKDEGHYVKFDKEKMTVYKNGHKVSSVERTDEKFFDKGFRAVQGMKEPVALTPAEWESEERSYIINSRARIIPTGISAADGLTMLAIPAVLKEYLPEVTMMNGYSVKEAPNWEQKFTEICINKGLEEKAADFAHLGKAADYLKDKKYKAEPVINTKLERTLRKDEER